MVGPKTKFKFVADQLGVNLQLVGERSQTRIAEASVTAGDAHVRSLS